MTSPAAPEARPPAPVALVAAHPESGEHEGHEHTSTSEWLSMGLWSGLALILVVGLALGLVLGARVMRKRAARRVPCPGCGLYLDPETEPVCPACGGRPGGGQQTG
jgi:hypothetical protein